MKSRLINRYTASAATTLSLLSTGSVLAQSALNNGIQAAEPEGQSQTDIESVIQNAINILLFIVGTAAVVMLIVGGIRYVVSSGDQQAVAGAKNTIIYAIVGIVVAVLAFLAVEFVFDQLQG